LTTEFTTSCLCPAFFSSGATADRARTISAGLAAADPLLGAERTAAPGAVELQPALRRFVDMNMDEEVWIHAVFSKNRGRLLNGEMARVCFQRGRGAGPTALIG